MKPETLGTRKITESDGSPEMAQCVKVLASKPDGWGSIPRTYERKGES